MKTLMLRWGSAGLVMLAAIFMAVPHSQAADSQKLEQFLTITGFDVALDSIALSAGDAPEMLGMKADDFGADWKIMAGQVFDPLKMRQMALEILGATLSDDLLDYASNFYASDLGQRLVVAENETHMDEDSDGKQEVGQAIVKQLAADGSPRLGYLQRMTNAIDRSGTSVRAVQEIQIRFLLAAAAAGVIEMTMEEADLREMMRENEPDLRRALLESSVASAAYAYRDFSDAEVLAYTETLETEKMGEVYELMNAVQYEVMANRFEVLAARMADLHPGQDI